MSTNRKILGPLEIGILIIALALIAYIVLKSSGGNVMERSENIQIVDNPSEEGGEKQIRNYEMRDEDRVEVILQQLSEIYSNDKNTVPSPKINQDKVVSDDEMKYLEEVKEKHKTEEKSENPADWLSILKASHQTYNKIKSVFEEADSGQEVKEDNVSNLLENAIVAQNIYSKIEDLFQIPEEDTKAFAAQGKKAVSDWAEFVEQNQAEKN